MSGLELFCAWAIPAFLALFVGTFVLDQAFRLQMRSRHAETWISLKGSTKTWYQPITKSLAFQRFLWTSAYLDLDDPPLNRLAGRLKVVSAVYLVYFLLMLIVLMMPYRPSMHPVA